MTLSWLELASLLAVPLLLGTGISRLLGLRARDLPLAYTGWSYMEGSLATGAVLFVWLSLGLPLDARWLAPVLLLLALGCWLCGARPARAPTRSDAVPRGHWERIETWLAAAIVALLVASSVIEIVRATLTPVVEGDEAKIWAHKAKLLFSAGGLGGAFQERAGLHPQSHLDYPLLNPLLQVWSFAHAGQVLHVENRLPIQAFMPALVLVLASALRRVLRPALAALLVLLVVQTVLFRALCQVAYADGMVALGLVCTCDAWLRWKASGSVLWWRLCMVSAAFLVWSKNEGLCYLALGGLAWAASALFSRGGANGERTRLGRELVWALLPLSVAATTWILNERLGFRNDLVAGMDLARSIDSLPCRIGPVLANLWDLFRKPLQGNYLFIGLLLLLLASPVRILRSAATRLPMLWVVGILAVNVLVYLVTPHDLAWHLATSSKRLLFQVLPLSALCLAVLAGSDAYFGKYVRNRDAQRQSGA